MNKAYASLLALESEYLKTNKRKSSIELTLCSTFTPVLDVRGRQEGEKETIEVRCVYDNPAQNADYQWFKAKAEELV